MEAIVGTFFLIVVLMLLVLLPRRIAHAPLRAKSSLSVTVAVLFFLPCGSLHGQTGRDLERDTDKREGFKVASSE